MNDRELEAARAKLPKPEQLTDMELLFPSNYLKSCDLKGKDAVLTIKLVEMDVLTMRGGGTKTKAIVHFAGTEKLLVCNRTNAELIAAALGTRNPQEWVGKRVTLYPTKVGFGRDMVDAIRVRDRAQAMRAARDGGGGCLAPAPVSAPEPEREPGQEG